MVGREPLTARERQGVWAFLCALPAFFIGIHVGILASEIGSHRDLASVLVRGGVCGAAPLAFALVSPRYWFIPSVIYAMGFSSGYTLDEAIRVGVGVFLALPFAVMTGERIAVPPEPSHPELLWLYVIALWMASFTAFLRLHFERKRATKS
jgi:hypothetical protein